MSNTHFCTFLVARQPASDCSCSSQQSVAIFASSKKSTYLASVVTRESGCGSLACPWLVRLPAGQSLSVHLYDFSTSPSSSSSSLLPHLCSVYAIIKDRGGSGLWRSETVCGGRQRLGLVYNSLGNEVEIRMNAKRDMRELNYVLSLNG